MKANKKYLILDVAASGTTGVGSVLSDFYNQAIKYQGDIEFVFVLSTPELKGTKGISVLRFPWIKKSWFHRLYFDYLVAPKLVKKYDVDKIISLQNTPVLFTKVPQVALVDKAIAFFDYPVSIKDEPKLWIHQNIIGRRLIKSLKKLNKIIVQCESFKDLVVQKTGISSDKIVVTIPMPPLSIKKEDQFIENDNSYSNFFYPASGLEYKNQRIIVEACKILKKRDPELKYKVILTIGGRDTPAIKKAKKEVDKYKLSIIFDGPIPRDTVYKRYPSSVLIFPSFVESGALPINEAKCFHSPVLASDVGYSHDFLVNYKNSHFFNPNKAEELADLMEKSIRCELKNRDINYESLEYKTLFEEAIV